MIFELSTLVQIILIAGVVLLAGAAFYDTGYDFLHMAITSVETSNVC